MRQRDTSHMFDYSVLMQLVQEHVLILCHNCRPALPHSGFSSLSRSIQSNRGSVSFTKRRSGQVPRMGIRILLPHIISFVPGICSSRELNVERHLSRQASTDSSHPLTPRRRGHGLRRACLAGRVRRRPFRSWAATWTIRRDEEERVLRCRRS